MITDFDYTFIEMQWFVSGCCTFLSDLHSLKTSKSLSRRFNKTCYVKRESLESSVCRNRYVTTNLDISFLDDAQR